MDERRLCYFPFSPFANERTKKSTNDVLWGTSYPVKQAPRFRRGFRFSTIAFVVQFGITGLVWWLWKRETRKLEKEEVGRQRQVDDDDTVPFADPV